ncbi:DUF1189 domain-containing protein [Legionella israelensis]|uniref:DUF1189 family protein n=1 Tax=Legionella israelensis TaxID=454 RepID=UPI00117D574A|nr:DUF1189 family protein [Legionella israelensis]QDP72605.1 DUF1189 domain-containing protein [Legionella israelensis]
MKKEKAGLKPIDKPVFGYWQALYRAFYSSRLYVDVGKRWKGFGFLYLLLVIVLFSIPLTVQTIAYFNRFYTQQIVEPLRKIPTLYIQNGEVNFDKPMPYFVKNEKGKVQVIIDTTGTISNLSQNYPEASILITKNKLYFRTPQSPLQYTLQDSSDSQSVYVEKLDKNMNQVFNGEEWLKNSQVISLKYLFIALVPPVVIGFFYVMFAIFIPVLALLGQVFSQVFFTFKISFKQSCRLLMVAGTPAILFFLVVLSLPIRIPAAGLILLIILSIYFAFALMFLKRESRRVVRQ